MTTLTHIFSNRYLLACVWLALSAATTLLTPAIAAAESAGVDNDVRSKPSETAPDSKQTTPKFYKEYFPYEVCLLVKIKRVVKKRPNIYLLEATIEDVYRGNYKKDTPLSISYFDYKEDSGIYSACADSAHRRQIIAFYHVPKNSEIHRELSRAATDAVYKLWMPYAGKDLATSDLLVLKDSIANSPMEPDKARAAFQKLLESRWTVERINDFCRPETRKTFGEATEHCANRESDWAIHPMHEDRAIDLGGKEVDWQAAVHDGLPTAFNISAWDSKKQFVWDVEYYPTSFAVWTDDDFLIRRIGHSIKQAAWAYWNLHHWPKSYSPEFLHLILDRTKEKVMRDEHGNVTGYQCRLSNDKTLTATLTADKLQTVDKIYINGVLDPGWNNMYKNNLINLARCNE